MVLDAPLELRREIGAQRRPGVGRHGRERLPEHLVGRPAVHLLRRLVPEQDEPVRSRLMIPSGEVAIRLRSISAEERRSSSSRFRSVTSMQMPVIATGLPASSCWTRPTASSQASSPSGRTIRYSTR